MRAVFGGLKRGTKEKSGLQENERVGRICRDHLLKKFVFVFDL